MTNAVKSSIIIFLLVFFIYLATSAGDTPYNYFTRLAESFVNGRLYLIDNPPWLSELITIGSGKYTFVNPPLPAVFLVPFVLIFGGTFPQQLLAHILGGLSAVACYGLAINLTHKKSHGLYTSILLSLGTIFWFLSSVGSVWYIGQVASLLLVFLSFYFLFRKKPNLPLTFLFFSLSCLCRTQMFVVFPVMIALAYLKKPKQMPVQSLAALGIIFFLMAAFFVAFYNLARFGSPFETGYKLIPGIMSEPWFSKGIFHPSYISNHLKIIFTGLPATQNTFPYIIPTWWGIAIWITTPAFVLALKANIKNPVNALSWVAIILIALINFSFGSTGFTQFGYRYAVDFYPFLFLLIISSLPDKLKNYHYILLFLSILVNAWGVILINKLGMVV